MCLVDTKRSMWTTQWCRTATTSYKKYKHGYAKLSSKLMHVARTKLHLELVGVDQTDHRENAGIQIGCSIAAEVTMEKAMYKE